MQRWLAELRVNNIAVPSQHMHTFGEPVNMWLSYDGLYAKIRNVLGKDLMSAHLFAFINRRATQMSVMYRDRSGFFAVGLRVKNKDD